MVVEMNLTKVQCKYGIVTMKPSVQLIYANKNVKKGRKFMKPFFQSDPISLLRNI
jgi:hypothetical protein